MSRRPSNRVEIDRLVVEGAGGDGRELARALTAELERLHGAGPAPGRAGGGRMRLADHSLEAPPGASPRAIGRQVARAIWTATLEARQGESR